MYIHTYLAQPDMIIISAPDYIQYRYYVWRPMTDIT
jgi:hypothetical protein